MERWGTATRLEAHHLHLEPISWISPRSTTRDANELSGHITRLKRQAEINIWELKVLMLRREAITNNISIFGKTFCRVCGGSGFYPDTDLEMKFCRTCSGIGVALGFNERLKVARIKVDNMPSLRVERFSVTETPMIVPNPMRLQPDLTSHNRHRIRRLSNRVQELIRQINVITAD